MPSTQPYPLSHLYVRGFNISYTNNTTLTVKQGKARDITNNFDISLEDICVLNTANVGINGLDKGTLAANTWYSLHVVGSSLNIRTPGVILSLSDTAPTLPPEYDSFRRLASIRTAGTAIFRNFTNLGNGNLRIVTYDDQAANLIILNAGNATSFTAVSSEDLIPPTARDGLFSYSFVPGAAGRTAKFRITGSLLAASDATQVITGQVTSVASTGSIELVTNNSQTFDYVVSNSGDALTMYVNGYKEFL
jgi:hypothetical protein